MDFIAVRNASVAAFSRALCDGFAFIPFRNRQYARTGGKKRSQSRPIVGVSTLRDHTHTDQRNLKISFCKHTRNAGSWAAAYHSLPGSEANHQ